MHRRRGVAHERRDRRGRGVHRRIRSGLPRGAWADAPQRAAVRSAGYSYVYLNYGIHCLVNVVTEAEGLPAAVLIRALEPLDGVATMRRRGPRGEGPPARTRLATTDLCRGPGNLTRAMGITLAENRLDLLGDRLFVEDRGLAVGRIAWGPRIGIRVGTERPWRASGGRAPGGVGGSGLDRKPRREYELWHCDQRSVRLSLLLSGGGSEPPRSRVVVYRDSPVRPIRS